MTKVRTVDREQDWTGETTEVTLELWRAETMRLAVKVENLAHEVGTLKEKLRRIVGYVNSAWREYGP